MTRKNKVGTILIFSLGAAAGAVTALLVARELRGDIAEAANDVVNQVRSSAKDVKHRTQKLVNSVKASVEDVVDAGQAAYERARNA